MCMVEALPCTQFDIKACSLAGIATGFWTEDWVLHHSDDEAWTRFQPSIAKEEVDKRLARWSKHVELSYNLDEQA